MTDNEAAIISNHVSEEYVDLGKTNFATKKELCECILWFQQQNRRYNDIVQEHRSKVTTFTLEILQLKQHP